MSKLFIKIKRPEAQNIFHSDGYERFRLKAIYSLKIFISIVAFISFSALIAEHGFYLDQKIHNTVIKIPQFTLYAFSVYYFFRIIFEKNKKIFIQSHRIELFLALLIILYLIYPSVIERVVLSVNPLLKPETLTLIYLIVTQTLALIAFAVEAVNQTKKIIYANIQPSMLLAISFGILISIGTLLLMLPKATVTGNINFVDAFFTATSAVTVTGLIVVDTQTYFTFTGHVIIMMLIQIGGLGIMTLTSFFAFTSGKVYNLKQYITIQEILGEESISEVKIFVYRVIITTFAIEAAAAAFIYLTCDFDFINRSSEKLFFSMFHSISAFCNAGFSLLGNNLAEAGVKFNSAFLLVIALLIVIGGLGFPVLSDLKKYFVGKIVRKKVIKLRLHSKLVLITSASLIVVGAVMFFLLETDKAMNDQSAVNKFFTSVFQSITTRTAGFNTIDIGKIALPTAFMTIILMWIGASPASTGGGIKTTTFAISLLNLFGISRGNSTVEIFKKRISEADITKAFSTIILSMIYIGLATFILTLTEKFSFDKILFEIISATSTVGLSMGITSEFSTAGKVILIVSMFVGRIGFLTLALALFKKKEIYHYDYVEERIII